MFIGIHDLELQKVEFRERFLPGRIDFGSEISQKGDLFTEGRAELIEEHHGGKKYVKDIRLVGTFNGEFESRCARCLDSVSMRLSENFDLLYRPLGAVKMPDEVSISDADTEIGFYQGEGLELAEAVKEQVLLAVPLRALCREDCMGLCPQCGTNKNSGECHCSQDRTDPRWAALADIREKFKT
jgi:uncharacterized protein